MSIFSFKLFLVSFSFVLYRVSDIQQLVSFLQFVPTLGVDASQPRMIQDHADQR